VRGTHAKGRATSPAYEWARFTAWPWIKSKSPSSAGWTAIATIAIAVLTGVYVHYARKQWREMHDATIAAKDGASAAKSAADEAKNANDIARISLQSVQRALLIPKKTVLQPLPVLGTNKSNWQIQGSWENVGNTTAIRVVGDFNVQILPSEPNEPLFIGSDPSSPIFIGPKTVQAIAPVYRPDVWFTLKKPPPLDQMRYVWGWIGYQDVFPNTPTHITEFCRMLLSETTHKDGTIDYGLTNCAHHNCADEDCADYKDVVQRAEILRSSAK